MKSVFVSQYLTKCSEEYFAVLVVNYGISNEIVLEIP